MARYVLLLILFFIVCTFALTAIKGLLRRLFGIAPAVSARASKPEQTSFHSPSSSPPITSSPQTSEHILYSANNVVVLQGEAKTSAQ